MKVSQFIWKDGTWTNYGNEKASSPQFVLIFGNRTRLGEDGYLSQIQAKYPGSDVIIASTSGEIIGQEVLGESITATAIEFEKTKVKVKEYNIKDFKSSAAVGIAIAEGLAAEDLANIMIFSDGQLVNGSELVSGLNLIIHGKVPVTGGLAGDEANFEHTATGLNRMPGSGYIVAIGLYGKNLTVGHGSSGGWQSFGPERIVTKAKDNVLFELDGINALDLYKEYLGDRASELPGSALLFPLSITLPETGHQVVRTILSVNNEAGSMTFAGNIPLDSRVRLMKASTDKLIDGSATSAEEAISNFGGVEPELAIMVSCVGRRLVLGPKAEDEVEEARNVIGEKAAITGFYSYGEISPDSSKLVNFCQLHNQTMTITTLAEA